MTAANACGVFYFFIFRNLKAHALVFYYVLVILFLLALSDSFITLFIINGFIFFVSWYNVTNVWLMIYIFFFYSAE